MKKLPVCVAFASLVLWSCTSLVKSAVGIFPGDRGVSIIVIDPSYRSTASIVADITPAVRRAADQGRRVLVYVSKGAVLAQVHVRKNGDLAPEGKSPSSWSREKAENTDVVLDTIERELSKTRINSPGDVAGAFGESVKLGKTAVRNTRGNVDLVIVTAGVVRRHDMDMLATGFTEMLAVQSADAVAASISLVPNELRITILGVASFGEVSSSPSSNFVAAVRAYWTRLCSKIDRCTLALSDPR